MLKNPVISSQKLIFLAALYFSTILNLSLWRFTWQNTNFDGVAASFFVCSLPFLIFCLMWAFFNLVLTKYLTKPLLSILLCVSAVANYAMLTYGVRIDSDMYRNVVETDFYEIKSLMTFSSLWWVFLSGVLPVVFLLRTHIIYKSLSGEVKRRTFCILASLTVAGVLFGSSYKSYVSFGRNHNEVRKLINPFNYLCAASRYYKKEATKHRRFVVLDEAPVLHKKSDQPNLLVVVIGETARAANFSLYGYAGATNPRLSRRSNLSLWSNTLSCGTATTISVPCLFAASGRKNFDVSEAKATQNLLDIALLAGYDVLWLENDGGCKGVCDRVPTRDVRQEHKADLCRNGSCFDEALLLDLDEKLQNLKADTLIVLHMMGSHGPTYFERYPDEYKKFQPTCDTADLQKCTQEEIRNTYDNTILYTDAVLDAVIEKIGQVSSHQSAMLYVSDHGESLGEHNLYLHGLPYGMAPDNQKKIPMILWMSPAFATAHRLNSDKKVYSSPVSHDYVYHTLLDLLEIKSSTYDASLNLFEQN